MTRRLLILSASAAWISDAADLTMLSAVDDVTTLRAAAAKRGVFMGAAVNAGHVNADAAYKTLAKTQYDLVTAENACKWGDIGGTQGSYNFADCDVIRDFTKNDMNGTFRGHNLCWGSYNPAWLKSLSASAKKEALIAHIKAVAAHYTDDAFAWDVVNEAITDSNSASDPLKNTDWYPDVPDYIDVAFTTARAAFPKGVKLFYNDYSITTSSGKADRVYNLVKGMIDRKVPIDGVGLQMHISSNFNDFAGLKTLMERFEALGLDVHITELDIPSSNQDTQASVYANLLQTCLDVKACKSFETWGLTDKYTWKGTSSTPLPFNTNMQPKAAVSKMLAVLSGAPSPSPPAPSPPSPSRTYETLTTTCQNAKAISDKMSVSSVDECQQKCEAEQSSCNSFDTDGNTCYLKSHCEGNAGACSGWCGHRVKTSSVTSSSETSIVI